MFSLHFFPDHLSRWPRWVMLFKHSKSIPCRCAGAALSLKCSSYNCEALVSWLPSSFPLFSVFFFFFFFLFCDLSFCLYSAEEIMFVLSSNALFTNALFGDPHNVWEEANLLQLRKEENLSPSLSSPSPPTPPSSSPWEMGIFYKLGMRYPATVCLAQGLSAQVLLVVVISFLWLAFFSPENQRLYKI